MHDKLYFKNLDSVRFIAATMVYLQHGMSPVYRYIPRGNAFLEKILYTVSNGGIGVSVFFVLSGFLITYLLISEYEIHQKISLRNFYFRRILRIWPLYLLIVSFSFFIYPFLKSLVGANNPLGSNVYYHLTFLSNFDVINIIKHCPGRDAMSQNITWSVSIEEQFYVFWPLIFVFLPKRFWLAIILGVICGSVFFRILNFNEDVVLYFHTFSVLVDLGIGGLAAYMIKENVIVKTFFENCSTNKHLLLFAFSVSLIHFGDTVFSFDYGHAISRIFISFSFALIICAQAFTKLESKLNLGNWSFANKWGKYTYGIYLIHPIVITLLHVLLRILKVEDQSLQGAVFTGVTGFFLTLIISKMVFKYYESWFLQLKNRFAIH